jgi:hypothetical protein
VSVYVDSETEAPAFAAVKIGKIGRRRLVLVPLADASVASTSITVKCGKKLAMTAPPVGLGTQLPAEAEAALYAHYELTYLALADSRRRLEQL